MAAVLRGVFLRSVAPSIYTVLSVLTVAISAYAQERSSQEESSRPDALRVFLDCASCDENYIRTEITFVNYVRDRTLADVHVLITTQATGGGGTDTPSSSSDSNDSRGSRTPSPIRPHRQAHRMSAGVGWSRC